MLFWTKIAMTMAMENSNHGRNPFPKPMDMLGGPTHQSLSIAASHVATFTCYACTMPFW